MRKQVVRGRAPQPNPYIVAHQKLLGSLDVSRILRQTEERVERSRQMLRRNYDAMRQWWWFPVPVEIAVSNRVEENMPMDALSEDEAA